MEREYEGTGEFLFNAEVGVFVCFHFELFYRVYWQTPLTI